MARGKELNLLKTKNFALPYNPTNSIIKKQSYGSMNIFYIYDHGLLGMTSCTLVDMYPNFGQNSCLHLQDSSALKMSAGGSSEMLVPIYQLTQCHIPNHNVHIHSQSIKTHTLSMLAVQKRRLRLTHTEAQVMEVM